MTESMLEVKTEEKIVKAIKRDVKARMEREVYIYIYIYIYKRILDMI